MTLPDPNQAMRQAMLTSSAIRSDTSMSTDVRTYLRRTTHLGEISPVGNRAQGGSKNFPLAEVNPAPAAAPRGLEAVGHA